MIKLRMFFKLLVIVHLVLLKVNLVLPQIQSRIVLGKLISVKDAPFSVRLLGDEIFICGGTLVGSRYALTAAHCIEDNQVKNFTIVAGVTYSFQQGQRSMVERISLPQNTFELDVAVLKLRYPVYGSRIHPIPLCDKDWSSGAEVQIYGWGKANANAKTISNQLRMAQVYLIDNESCLYKFRKGFFISKTMICASTANQKDVCVGDAGGPAVINGQLCGIISWGESCAHNRYPSVYTNVFAARQFIDYALKKLALTEFYAPVK